MRDKDETAREQAPEKLFLCAVCGKRHARAGTLSSCEQAELDAAVGGERYGPPGFEASPELIRAAQDPEAYQAERDLRAAKERLGAWVTAEHMRSWLHTRPGLPGQHPEHSIQLWIGVLTTEPELCALGEGPTEAAAILAALEKVNA